MGLETALFSLVILIFSVVIHEVSHGIIAEKLGDPTARLAGRLTLNPLPHIDPFSSVLLPLFLLLVNSPVLFGAAKPVPVNYSNLRNPRRDMALVALAGPGANLLLAFFCALPVRFGLLPAESAGGGFLLQVVVLNLVLAIFNLVPIPPLDGSKILARFLPDRYLPILFSLEQYGFFIIIILIYSGFFQYIIFPILKFLLYLLLGAQL
ncbi:MAG: hypothetical protein A2722_01610 [Candidatus Doudnabacteria bacterium RIFCSPHIGHO2_01_FULL_50_11]|uniref:Peptidase M50 domain-containing protein n=1 Tax=Candidatus Doudnabacteria bacterium RIFCSPHIGHO2_01_FULL_50_11 TaxID=1817828 RepID=A0A1F5PE84_9BACT|nr:MAG: hypothetical protein A2722_01610 [Candidatus Doudnabacteria bacterium RIFCSPHIGHO2_01_FULL_50_11]HLC44305.1 site-2 protease family protein [Patescibacteria group bacterium]